MEDATLTAECRLLQATFELLSTVDPLDRNHRFNGFVTDYLVTQIQLGDPVWFVGMAPQINAFKDWLIEVRDTDYRSEQHADDLLKIQLLTHHFFRQVPPAPFSKQLRTMLLEYTEMALADIHRQALHDVVTDFLELFAWLDVAEETIPLIDLTNLPPIPEEIDPHEVGMPTLADRVLAVNGRGGKAKK
jgi:hypothetical protein